MSNYKKGNIEYFKLDFRKKKTEKQWTFKLIKEAIKVD